jgi:hypothetical protein
MPIPKWCDKKSIRSIKRGKASILICCPKRHFKSGRCSVGTRAIDVLTRGTKKERQEHPWASKATARKIARDHLKRDSRAYGSMESSKRIRGGILMDAVAKRGAATYLFEDEIKRMISEGLIERVSDHKAVATEKGRAAFTSGRW